MDPLMGLNWVGNLLLNALVDGLDPCLSARNRNSGLVPEN
jgi:hypothetical protein